MDELARELVSQMPELTKRRASTQAIANTEQNAGYIGKTVADLAELSALEERDSAIIIGAGPSLHAKDSVGQIVRSNYHGVTISVDGALSHCLRNGLVPDYVVTVDPHTTRIGRWFGDPSLTVEALEADDYFRRQDLDPYFTEKEMARNQQVIDMVNAHGSKIRAVIATSAAENVVKRCISSGMELFWWNPLYDDFDDQDSMTRKVFNMNKVPCMVSGGNVGTAAWVIAHAVLGMSRVGLVGMDMGYAPGTALANTQYYNEIEKSFGERAKGAFIDVVNPYLNETWFTDPTYYWYKETFLDMASKSDCETFNCSEGGILFGEGVAFTSLQSFLTA